MGKKLNRIKIVLHECEKTTRWLAEHINVNESTVSRWCTNDAQPSIETLDEIAKILHVDIRELLQKTK